MKGSEKGITRYDLYDSPIDVQVGALQMAYREELDRKIFKMVQQVGIEIDEKGLVDALNQDRKRYEAAYKDGYRAAGGCLKDEDPNLCVLLANGMKVYFKNVQTIFMLASKPTDITFLNEME